MELIEINSHSDIQTLEQSIDKMVWYRDQKTQVMNISHTRVEKGYNYIIEFRNGQTLEIEKSAAEYEKYQRLKLI